MLKGLCNISIHKGMTAPNQPISRKKLGADPCTQPPCRPTLDGSHVCKKKFGLDLNFGGSTFVGLLQDKGIIYTKVTKWIKASGPFAG